jgi:hypothetical protein
MLEIFFYIFFGFFIGSSYILITSAKENETIQKPRFNIFIQHLKI